jgi:hypothetical protein
MLEHQNLLNSCHFRAINRNFSRGFFFSDKTLIHYHTPASGKVSVIEFAEE